MTLSPARRAHLASIQRLGGLSTAARIDTAARARAGQAAFRASFADGHGCKLCPRVDIPKHLPERERARRAAALMTVHFSRLARQRKGR